MKTEFNPDGSVKLPEWAEKGKKEKEEAEQIFQNEKAIKIDRVQISSETPLKCELIIQASNSLENPERIKSIYEQATGKFRHMATLYITKINDREYKVTIISGMYRCSWCDNFVRFLEEEMKVKVINWENCFIYSSSRKY